MIRTQNRICLTVEFTGEKPLSVQNAVLQRSEDFSAGLETRDCALLKLDANGGPGSQKLGRKNLHFPLHLRTGTFR